VKREDWDRRYAQADLLWSAKPNRVLVAEVGGLSPGRALDLACGEGQNAVWLAERGWSVRGVDYSSVAIAKARARAEQAGVGVDFLCADLADFEPEPESYDLVAMLFLHLPRKEWRAVLARALAALAPGGTLLLVGHDLLNLTEGVGGPSDPDVLLTPDDIVAELHALEITKAERVLRDVDGEARPAIDFLVRARRPKR
jgi:2-polyprenyl-3-methyl-5-hydroxy-6-metoxy-1,4-benzoquinol methylase